MEQCEAPIPSVATRAADFAGGGGENATEEGGSWTRGHRVPEPQLPPGAIRVVPQIFSDVRPRDVGPDRRSDGWSPVNVLEDTVARMKRDMAEIRLKIGCYERGGFNQWSLLPGRRRLQRPRYPGLVERPVGSSISRFLTLVLSNGWDDATAALQLLSHLLGDALKVALLVPMARRTSRKGLVDALSVHYGLPDRLQTTV